MPKVKEKTKSAAGKEYRCQKCREAIEAGQRYYTWAFRYGGTFRRHVACGEPRPSELTQSKLSDVFAAVEACEDAVGDMAEFADALEAAVEEINRVADEYEEAAEAFGGAGENQERAEALRAWAEELDGKAEAIRDGATAFEEAQSTLGECPV